MRFLVDFNDIIGDDLIEAALADADEYFSPDLTPASLVQLYDGSGHQALAHVLAVREPAVLLVIDWPTWTSEAALSRAHFSFRIPAATYWTAQGGAPA